MATTYSAGVVTAYGAAKQAGYTGTYQEFCEQQANFAQNAATVATNKEAVVAAATQVEQNKTAAENAANAAKSYAQSASESFHTDILAPLYDARSRYDTGEYVIQQGVMYRCTTPIAVPEAWNAAHWEQITISSELIGALKNVITAHFQRNKTYVVGDYVIYDNALYRCIAPTKPGYAWDPNQWAHVTIAGEFADRVTDLEKSFAFPDNKNLVNPSMQQIYQGNVFAGYSQYYVSGYIPFEPNTDYVLRTIDGPGDFVYEVFDKEKASLSSQIEIKATDVTNDMIIRSDEPGAALIRIISPIELKDIMLAKYEDNNKDFVAYKLKSTAYISTIVDQELTDDQKEMVQRNIGLDNISNMISGVVKYNESQELTSEQKQQAQQNIGVSEAIQTIIDNMPSATDLTGSVRYDVSQPDLNEEQKAQARTNIGAISESAISGYNDRIGELEEDISEYAGAVRNVVKSPTGLRVDYFQGESSQVELAESEKLHLYYDTTENFLYLQNENDENQGSPVYIAGGGGGGGGSTVSASVKVQRLDENNEPTSVATCDVISGENALLRFILKVVESGEDGEEIAGTATARWYNNSIFLTTTSIVHNVPTYFDVTPYLQPGPNSISVSVSVPVGGDITYPASRNWSVNLVDLYFAWDFDTARINTMAFTDIYTVYGNVDKYMHLAIDAADINNPIDDEQHSPYPGGKKIEGSGREFKETIPKLSHGVHTLTRWLTAKVNGVDVEPKYQTYEVIFFEDGQTQAVVSADTSDFVMDQYSTKKISFIVADPTDLSVDARILIDGEVKATFTGLDRTQHIWNYTAMDSGARTIRIEALRTVDNVITISAAKQFVATINPISMNVQEMNDYIFKLKASELGSNTDLQKWHNEENTVSLKFSDNFDWVNGGLQYETDDNGNVRQFICIKAGTEMTVKHKLFSTAAQDTGLDFKIAFKIVNVQDYDASWGKCMYNGRGLQLFAHNADMTSNVHVSTLYEEDSYIEYELEVYKKDNDPSHASAPHNYVMAWLDGVPANIAIYDSNDSFAHPSTLAPEITIGSEDCDVYIYLMKVYQHSIDYQNHVDGFIVDAPTGEEMVKRYDRNNILNSTTNDIDYQLLADKNRDLRIYLYDIPYMTMDKIKKDPVSNCKFQQIWRNGGEEYQLQGTCTMGVQGTSSINYRRGAANTDSRFSELTYTRGGQVVDLLENGVYIKDDTYGDNWYVKDPENPKTAKIFTKLEAYVESGIRKTYSVKEARSLARLQEGEELNPLEWTVYTRDENNEPLKYLRVSDENYSIALGPEWIVRYRDENREATHYVKALGYKINDTSCPITYSNIKVNYASCEQVNNYCNAMWYQKFQPFPSRTARDCMEFSMGVQFIKDRGEIPNDGKHMLLFTKPEVDANGNVVMVNGRPNYVQDGKDRYHMYSIANMGTSKNNVHIFHDISNEKEVCVEIKNNTHAHCRFIEYTDDPINWDASDTDPFELRYPSTKNPRPEIDAAWRRLWKWMYENHPGLATNARLDTPETYGEYVFKGHHRPVPENQNTELTNFAQVLRGTRVTQYAGTYTTDSFERRMAKMLSTCEDYLCMDSVIYHFLYTERHTNVDNVAKNTFWSTDDWIHWDLSKAYDMDTSDGNNNEGIMTFDYGNEWNDVIGTKNVFNANDSAWFVFAANLKEACATMFRNREALGAWNYKTYHNFLKTEQNKVPERCWVQCYYYDYIRAYERQLELVANRYTYLDGGRKTHQREHFEKYQEVYLSGKYNGSAAEASAIQFRGYSPDNYAPSVPPSPKVKLKMYNKMYATVDVDGKKYTRKFEKDENAFIDFSENKLNDTVIKIYPASMIQEIDNLAPIYGGDYNFDAASKLKTLALGSNEPGYQNSNFFNLSLANNPMLETLEVQNLVNGEEKRVGTLNLSHCPSLVSVDATGSDFTGVSFAKNGLINSVKLKAPTTLSLLNLRYLTDANLIIADYSKIFRLAIEDCIGIDALAMIKKILAIENNTLSEARLIGMIWNAGLTNEVLTALYAMSGFDETGYQTPHSVLAGEGLILSLTRRLQNLYSSAWPNFDLTVTSPTEEKIITFMNEDGTPVLDKNGEPYFQYVEEGAYGYDPIQAGEIDTPTMADTDEYTAVFSYFENLDGAVYMDKVVTARYNKTKKRYRVTWYSGLGGTELHHETVEYGSEAVYDYNTLGYPKRSQSGWANALFDGWDKSTGYITGTTDVFAKWVTHSGPLVKLVRDENGNITYPDGYVPLKNYTAAQVGAAIAQGSASDYWEEKDYIDINVGADFDYSNVDSTVIVGDGGLYAKDLVLNGSRIFVTGVKLFSAESPSFTLALDYEFSDETAERTLVSCYDSRSIDAGGFQLRFRNATSTPYLSWGDKSCDLGGLGTKRSMLVLTHEKGSKIISVYSNNITRISGGQTKYQDFVFGSTVERTTSFISEQATLVLGGISTTGGSASNTAKGTIHWCKVWWDLLGTTDTRALANWPHETWRMHYVGSGRYKKVSDGLPSNATFVINSPLASSYIYDTTSVRDSSYTYSKTLVHAFINGGTIDNIWHPGRVFEALPLTWRSLIQEVELTEQMFYADYVNTPQSFRARVYLPAAACFSNTLQYGLQDEDNLIPWYAQSTGIQDLNGSSSGITDSRYIKSEIFPGAITGEDTKRYRSNSDPSEPGKTPVPLKDGDIWFNSNTSYDTYMFVSTATLDKIGWFADINKNSEAGDVFAARYGGKWFRSHDRIGTRTRYPYSNNNSTYVYFYMLTVSGLNGYNYSTLSPIYLMPMFSI